MMDFLVYEGKVAVALLVFYLFYRFLLKKETFHRFNRMMLVGTAFLSFLLPLCVITIHKPMSMEAQVLEPMVAMPDLVAEGAAAPVEASGPWWHIALVILFWAGAAVVVVRVVASILSIARIISQSELVREEDGCKVYVTDKDIDPFSWMKYIVLSRKDWEGEPLPILAHEKAHIRFGHSVEVLLVDVLSALQWFNPAIWMLRSDLRELHEFEADDDVLRGGANLKEYQFLLIRKAVSKSGYSIANSFNHSILKNRIKMMSKAKSPFVRGLRALYLLPLVCLGIGLQAKTVFVPEQTNEGDKPLILLRQPWGEEKEITKEEFDNFDQGRISSLEVLKDDVALKKYGEKAVHGVIVVHLKVPYEMDQTEVFREIEDDGQPIPFRLIADTMPSFQGGGMNEFCNWLSKNMVIPKECNHSGTMKVMLEIGKDGYVKDVEIRESVCAELDALTIATIKKSPKWEPGTNRGEPIDQTLVLPIVFSTKHVQKQ